MIRLSLFSLPSAGRRLGAAATLLGALALASVACSDRLPTGGVAPDDTRPTVSIAGGTPAADTLIAVSVTAHDDLGLKQVLVQVRGAVTLDTVITFNSVQKDVTIPIELAAPRTVSPGTTVTVSAQAFDGRTTRPRSPPRRRRSGTSRRPSRGWSARCRTPTSPSPGRRSTSRSSARRRSTFARSASASRAR